MSFRECLERISDKVDDLLGVAIVDAEGIMIQEVKADLSFDLISLVAEYSAFVKAADKASVSSDIGFSHQITVTTEKITILIKKINPEYFLFLAAETDKNMGKAKFFMKREAYALAEDL
jgi:predicted regulator of Ras-like GTPase activity (Roadblock/LC7/MglB family)